MLLLLLVEVLAEVIDGEIYTPSYPDLRRTIRKLRLVEAEEQLIYL
jgi:hypothetical protein